MKESAGSPKTTDEARDLDQAALEALDWDDAARIKRIWELQDCWIPYPRANAIIRAAEELLNRPQTDRMQCLLVHAAPNSGKTRLQRRYCALHPINLNPDGPAMHAAVLRIELQKPDEGAFYDSLLMELRAPFNIQDRPPKKRHQVMNILARIGTRQLVIDEFNTAIAGHRAKQRDFLVALKNFLNELKITAFAAGTPDASVALTVEGQLHTRFDQVELSRWSDDGEFRRLLESFESRLPLRQASNLQSPSMASMIHDLGEGYLGEVAELLMRAAVVAVKTGAERIDRKILENLRWKTSSQRRAQARGIPPPLASPPKAA